MGFLNANAVFVTLAIFIVGCVFHAGRLSSRIDSLESWRDDIKGDLKEIRGTVDHINGALRSERT